MPHLYPPLELAAALETRRRGFPHRGPRWPGGGHIARHRGRSFLIVLLIMLPVAGMTAAGTLYQSSQRTPQEIVRYELGNTQARFVALPTPNGDSIQDPMNDAYVRSSTGER